MIQVFIALLLLPFFAFGAPLADLGFVRLTQRQMSNAADGVALEALRLEDSLSDADRRQAACKRMQDFFDDDQTFGDDYNPGAVRPCRCWATLSNIEPTSGSSSTPASCTSPTCCERHQRGLR
ncbi:MAG: Tad domain-containing protein [Planctomycetota bacterium]